MKLLKIILIIAAFLIVLPLVNSKIIIEQAASNSYETCYDGKWIAQNINLTNGTLNDIIFEFQENAAGDAVAFNVSIFNVSVPDGMAEPPDVAPHPFCYNASETSTGNLGWFNITFSDLCNISDGNQSILFGSAGGGSGVGINLHTASVYPPIYFHGQSNTWYEHVDGSLTFYLFGGIPEASAGNNTLNISETEPAESNSFNTQLLNFNATVNASFVFNCSLHVNDTLNQTTTGFSAGTDIAVDWDIAFGADAEQAHNYSISCWDNSSIKNSTRKTFYVDNVDPGMVVDADLESNLSITYKTNLSASINCSDTYLYSMNISIDGKTFYNVTNLAATSNNYLFSYNGTFQNTSVGVHRLQIECFDGHTKNEIDRWVYSKNVFDKSIKYKFDNGWIKIKPVNKGLFTGFDTKKLVDRYTFEYDRDWSAKLLYGSDLEFEVSSNYPLDISNKDNFRGWLISKDLEKWIDFESKYKDAEVSVTRISSNKINVLIEGIEEDSIVFSSAGELNNIVKNYTFYFGNVTETYKSQSLETGNPEFKVNFTRNSSHVTDVNAVLNWNGTIYASTKTTATDCFTFNVSLDVPLIDKLASSVNQTGVFFNWTFNVTGTQNNESNSTDTNNQSIYKMIITNCSSLTTIATLNFSVQDENDVAVKVDMDALFTVWNYSSERNWSLSFENSSIPGFCLYPEWATLHSNYELDYEESSGSHGYEANSYISSGANLTNVSQNITLYIYANGTEITVTVVDQYDVGQYGLAVEAYEYDTSTNNYTLVAMEETDLDGIVKLNLYTTKKHKFIVRDGTEIKYTSSTFKLFQTSYTFRIAGEAEASIIVGFENLERDLTWNSTSRNVTLTWNDLTNMIYMIYLDVYKVNVSNTTILSQQTSTADSGYLIYNIENRNRTYIANVFINATTDNQKYFLESLIIDEKAEYEIFGAETLIMALLFIGTVSMIGITISAEVSMALAAMGMIIFYILGFINVALSGIIALIIGMIVIIVKVSRER